jgi:hypothetical protein
MGKEKKRTRVKHHHLKPGKWLYWEFFGEMGSWGYIHILSVKENEVTCRFYNIDECHAWDDKKPIKEMVESGYFVPFRGEVKKYFKEQIADLEKKKAGADVEAAKKLAKRKEEINSTLAEFKALKF